MTNESAAYVVTVTPTIDSGTCVRWYRDLRGHLFDALLADLAADGPTLTERRKVLGL